MLGLPEPLLFTTVRAMPRDANLLSFDYPDFNPFMANGRVRGARGAATTVGYLNRGTPRNVEILDEA
jgi:hypothetical protein